MDVDHAWLNTTCKQTCFQFVNHIGIKEQTPMIAKQLGIHGNHRPRNLRLSTSRYTM